MSRSRYVKRISLALVATAVLAAATTAAVVIGGSDGGASADETQNSGHLFVPENEAVYDLSILEANSRAKVAFPEELNPDELGTDGLQRDTIRLVATVNGASTYVALDNSNLLCVVTFIPGDDWVSGSTCTTPDSFSKSGFGLRIGSPSDGFEAYIVPDSNAAAVKTLAESAEVLVPQQNLVVVDYELPENERAELIKKFKGQPVPVFEKALSDES